MPREPDGRGSQSRRLDSGDPCPLEIETLGGSGYRFVRPIAEVARDRTQGVGRRVQRSTPPQALTSFIGRELASVFRRVNGY